MFDAKSGPSYRKHEKQDGGNNRKVPHATPKRDERPTLAKPNSLASEDHSLCQ